MNPKVSVIIPTYNNAAHIIEAIDSVLAQAEKDLEIIVVDDGSTDNTKEMIQPRTNQIKYFYKTNGGPASSRNLGIRNASGQYIAFLDSDDSWLPDKLEKQLRVIESDPKVGLVACGTLEVSSEGKLIREVKRKNYARRKQLIREMYEGNVIGGGSTALVRKSCFDEIGLFDEHLHGVEDWDMWLRIALSYDVAFVAEALTKARILPNSVSSTDNVLKMQENEMKLLKKIFSDKRNRLSFFQRQRSLSGHYFRACWAYYIKKNLPLATRLILKSFFLNPASYLRKKRGTLLVKILIIRILRMSIPVNRLTKPIFRLLYATHVFLREGLLCFLKFIYFEPLFRSQCHSIGKGLWMEKLPYMNGKGKIIIGDFVRLSGKPNISFSQKIYGEPELIIGNHTFIGGSSHITVAKRVAIGNNCLIAGNTYITDNDGHPIDPQRRLRNDPPDKESVKEV